LAAAGKLLREMEGGLWGGKEKVRLVCAVEVAGQVY
jgi:hypothetical protein